MKICKLVLPLFALAGLSGQVLAGCPAGNGGYLNQTQLQTTFASKTVCAARGSDRWQEFHEGATSGALIDYKLGPDHKVDPSKKVGDWRIEGNGNAARLVHDYGSGGVYSYRVFGNGGNSYSLCNGTSGLDVTVLNGKVPCGF